MHSFYQFDTQTLLLNTWHAWERERERVLNDNYYFLLFNWKKFYKETETQQKHSFHFIHAWKQYKGKYRECHSKYILFEHERQVFDF